MTDAQIAGSGATCQFDVTRYFRHMHATAMLDTGATPKVTQRQLRHADPRVTLDHYAHLIDSTHREAVERAAAFLDRSGLKWTQN